MLNGSGHVLCCCLSTADENGFGCRVLLRRSEEKRSQSMESQQQRTSGRSLRGFASMDKEKQKEIASKGGRAAHEKGTAHEFNSNEASAAAKKGHERGTAHEFTPEEARVAGRKGGLA